MLEMKEEVKDLKEKGLAIELLSDYKKINKRQFIIILVILTMWFLTIGYLVYLQYDIGVEETTTQEISDLETINGNVINKGNSYDEDKTNSK